MVAGVSGQLVLWARTAQATHSGFPHRSFRRAQALGLDLSGLLRACKSLLPIPLSWKGSSGTDQGRLFCAAARWCPSSAQTRLSTKVSHLGYTPQCGSFIPHHFVPLAYSVSHPMGDIPGSSSAVRPSEIRRILPAKWPSGNSRPS